ncbi:MAG TPA: tRNA pseudouridine(55) synthase TruB [Magnetospirillaceae bacterium]|jgi:tRNA pseudouridine55 synthase
MGRKRTGLPINGWVVLDKPLGLSSAQAVAAVRRTTGAAKAGHGGTLDPLATGILPIALGEATKTVSFVMDGAKTYRFRAQWGESRSTDDNEGEIVGISPNRPTKEAILGVLPRFEGNIEQIPPVFSALKVDGERAYALARAGNAPELAPRRVQIDKITLLATETDWADFEVRCGKGTYIRSLARDLGQALGTLAFVAELRRTACGPFTEIQAISLDTLGVFVHSAASFVLPVATALDDIPALAVTEDEAQCLSRGQPIPVLGPDGIRVSAANLRDTVVRVQTADRLVALARIDDDMVRPVRVLHL